MSGGTFSRITIDAYKESKDPKVLHYDNKQKVQQAEFIVQANPETFSMRYTAQYNAKNQAPGTAAYDPVWEKHLPRTLTLEFIFDGTGAIPRYVNPNSATKKEDVGDMLARFKQTVYDINGDTHTPHYLELIWGAVLLFKCRLTDMTITYKMFSPDGLPLRATVSATFQEVIPKTLAAKKPKKTSPDVTHKRIAKEGDNLPQLAKEIYGDEKYYVAIAKANKLIQFRNMPAGQEIYFPPIDNE